MEGKVFTCPDEFKDFIKELSAMELVLMIKDLRQHPDDSEYLLAAQLELKNKLKEKINES